MKLHAIGAAGPSPSYVIPRALRTAFLHQL